MTDQDKQTALEKLKTIKQYGHHMSHESIKSSVDEIIHILDKPKAEINTAWFKEKNNVR